MDYSKESLSLHKRNKGKIEIKSKIKLSDKRDLSLAYTPGVAEPCRKIDQQTSRVYDYTIKGNSVAVVSNGTAVLGLGDIGPHAAMPVMEGKCLLFKKFAGIDAYPICLDAKDSEKVIEITKAIAPGFGGINLEDIKAPECFKIEEKLAREIDIPVFHDDQHGTAIVVLAALINALKIVKKEIGETKIVVSGAGAAGIATARLLLAKGAQKIILVDRKGIIYKGREELNPEKQKMAELTNPEKIKGDLQGALEKADVFIGISSGNLLKKIDIKKMSSNAIVFAMANPIPEIMPDEAKKGGAIIVATGRSDFENQINNVLVFPGFFRGLLDSRAKKITTEMKLSAAHALAKIVKNPTPKKIIPSVFEKNIAKIISSNIQGLSKKDCPKITVLGRTVKKGLS